jgi:hypothetical protein
LRRSAEAIAFFPKDIPLYGFSRQAQEADFTLKLPCPQNRIYMPQGNKHSIFSMSWRKTS